MSYFLTRLSKSSLKLRISPFPPSALSEILGKPLPYDDIVGLRDRMWEISPTLLRTDAVEPTSIDTAAMGLKTIATINADAKVSGAPFKKPISNFYQTDVISRAYVFFSFFCIIRISLSQKCSHTGR